MSAATATAFDPSAPQEQRTAALAELQQQHMPASSDIGKIVDYMKYAMAEQEDMVKARGNVVVPFPSNHAAGKKPGMQSVYLDDWQIGIQGDYFEKGGSIGFDAMRMMVDQTPVLQAVIMTRIRQISRFCRVQESGQGMGFVVRHKDRDHQVTPDEKRSIILLQDFISNCGWEKNPRRRRILKRDNFSGFMAKSVRDSLVMDSAPIETEMKRARSLGIDGFYAVDGATIRLCTEDGYEGDDDIFAIQLVQGRVSTLYDRDKLIYEPRNPVSDVRMAGYGISEVEQLVRIVTGWLNAMTYNIKGFDSNAIPRGLLHLSGEYGEQDLAAFKRYWNSMVKGINNAWSLPVMVSKNQESKASFENFGVEFNEMYFAKWMTFLTSIICAVFSIAPEEINFEGFSGGNSGMKADDTAEKLTHSADKGLHPILSYYENTLSDFILSDFDDKYVLRFTGLDEEDEKQRFEKDKLILTVDELRAQQGYNAHSDPTIGAAPLNPALMSVYQAAQQAAQPKDFGDPNSPNGGDDATPDASAAAENAYQGGADPNTPPGGDPGAGGADFGDGATPDYGNMAKALGLPVIHSIEG